MNIFKRLYYSIYQKLCKNHSWISHKKLLDSAGNTFWSIQECSKCKLQHHFYRSDKLLQPPTIPTTPQEETISLAKDTSILT